MISAREELVQTFREAKQGIDLASAIEGGLEVQSAAMRYQITLRLWLKDVISWVW